MNVRQLTYLMLLVALAICKSTKASGNEFITLAYSSPVAICPLQEPLDTIPDFNGSNCRQAKLSEIDPQNQAFWVQIHFDLQQSPTRLNAPLGLLISGKAASTLYLNGTLLGHNGRPAKDSSEIPGSMDAIFYIPESLLQPAGNTLTLLLSGQHSIVTLDYPMHIIGIGSWSKLTQQIQPYTAGGLALMGAFAVGALYFLVLSFGHDSTVLKSKFHYPLFAAMCFLAMVQLGAEMSRGLINYLYPWQDIRLLIITVCAFLFGVMLLCYNSLKVAQEDAIHWIYIGSFVTLLAILTIQSFDARATLGILIPVLINLVQNAYYFLKNKKNKLRNGLFIHLVIATIIFISSTNFHEFLHFLIIALVLLIIFVLQARDYQKQQNRLLEERAQIAKLEFRLAQQSQIQAPVKLELASAGKLEFVNVADIAFCKASGDYVELHLNNQAEKLFSGSLKQLSSLLPDTFLRVHRSYMVNLDEVSSQPSVFFGIKCRAQRTGKQTLITFCQRLIEIIREHQRALIFSLERL